MLQLGLAYSYTQQKYLSKRFSKLMAEKFEMGGE
jgi:hypothetical protein